MVQDVSKAARLAVSSRTVRRRHKAKSILSKYIKKETSRIWKKNRRERLAWWKALLHWTKSDWVDVE